ncbi:MAG: aminopeptidase N [Burkholderiaceae bacterium]|nr:aminopeptidase N [Burkholderiaceae bacterium]
MRTEQAITVFRKDYTPPGFWVEHVNMGFDLDLKTTVVAAEFTVKRNRASPQTSLRLFGRECPLVWIAVNGRRLSKADYHIEDELLTIENMPDSATVQVVTELKPSKNTSMMGLYASRGNFFTQCEAEGFRRITWFPDHPDVMATYTVMLRANRKDFPVLLSNGNLIEAGKLPDGRHYAKWNDPFRKPSYLFALVAGKLACLEETIKIGSGEKKLLQVYVEKHDLKKAAWAMQCLKNAIGWDEARFGLALDLERFMIVAVSDFNMGAMENKGLNIFNTSAILAHRHTQTDDDFARVEAVVGHEYFHNWTGNRVTCRDWFQLTLKEGLTVFRDQEFSADMAARGLPALAAYSARAVQRIANVRNLRSVQFAEDAGPLAHPIRPESFQDISNFYTATVYEKGAEVIRMQHTLLGEAGFRKGMDLYFQRHDGSAVTCDDFVQALEDGSAVDLSQMRRWYAQAGTPSVKAQTVYDEKLKTFTLTLSQSCPKIGVETLADTPEKQPFHIPFTIGLLDSDGKDLPLHLKGEKAAVSEGLAERASSLILDFKEASQTFVFTDVPEEPVPSLLRGYPAPVNLEWEATDQQLAFLLANDSDAFNRWEAGQQLAIRRLVALTQAVMENQPLMLDKAVINAFASVLANEALDAAFKREVLMLPSEAAIGSKMSILDPSAIRTARIFMTQQIAQLLKDQWVECFWTHQSSEKYSPDPVSMGKRALKNLALAYWLETGDLEAIKAAKRQYKKADNMTDRFFALNALVNLTPEHSVKALNDFYKRFEKEALVIDKWFRLQAGARWTNAKLIRSLSKHKAYTLENPNRMRSLLFTYMLANDASFHALDGSGYDLWTEFLPKVDKLNPEVAARLARALDRWRKLTPQLQSQARAALERISRLSLSKPSSEVLNKALLL